MSAGRPPFRDSGLPSGAVDRSDGAGADRTAIRREEAARRREEAPESLPSAPPCPFCEGAETELMNAFGAHASVSTYWCRACRSPFELMRWR